MHAESSEALLVGQKPKMQLLLHGVDQVGQHISSIEPLLTNDFVVSFNSIDPLLTNDFVVSFNGNGFLITNDIVASFISTESLLTYVHSVWQALTLALQDLQIACCRLQNSVAGAARQAG